MKNSIKRRKFIKSAAAGVGLLSLGMPLISCSTIRKKPNIIFFLTDDLRWDALGCAGNPIIQTPHIDSLARDGIRFEQAFVTTPICAASRASIFTGLYERKTGYTFGQPPLRLEYTNLSYPKLLKDAGYRTGFIGKFGVKVPEGITHQWFDYFKTTAWPYFQEVAGEKKHLTDIHLDLAIEYLQGCKSNEPFCLSLSTWAPHADDGQEQQYFWPHACDDLYKNVTIPPPILGEQAFFASLPEFVKKSMNRERWYWRFDTPEKYQEMVKGYYRMISGIDMALGRLLNELKKMDRDQDTVIIFMSDNGYFLGERGFAGKWTMHELSIRVPLIIYDPGMKKTRNRSVQDNMALNIDIAPTILEMAGLAVPEGLQGKSLVPLMKGDNIKWRDKILIEHLWDLPEIPQTEGVRTKEWKYIRYPQHPDYEELYNLPNDPQEKHNLAFNQKYAELMRKMRLDCDRLIKKYSS